MDIAKIRKKAQSKEKENRAEEMPVHQPVEPTEKEVVASSDPPRREEQHRDISQESVCPTDLSAQAGAGRDEFRAKDSEQKADEQVDETRPREENKSEEKEEDTLLELLTFSLSKEEFAFRVSEVEEITRYQRITTVPTMPNYVLGITSLRGKIIPVIDLKTRLGLKKNSMSDDYTNAELAAKSGTDPNGKIVVVSGPKGLIGASIDRVIGVVRFPNSEMLEPPAHLTEAELKFIEGVVIFEKRFISIIRSEDTMNIDVS